MKKDKQLWCPLYNRNIALGKCLDINYERLHFIRGDYLIDLAKSTKKSITELSKTCSSCPNQPFPDGKIGKVIHVRRKRMEQD